MTSPRAAGALLVLSPIGILFGWSCMRLMGEVGDEPLWTIGHLVWLPAYVALTLGLVGMYRLIESPSPGGRLLAGSGLVLTVLGGAAVSTQMAVDLVVGFATANRQDMSDMFDAVQGTPGVELTVYAVDPSLLYVGMLVLAVHAAVRGRIPGLSGGLVAVAVVIAGLDQALGFPMKLGMASALVLLLVAMVLTRRQLIADGKPAGRDAPAAVR
ncbi:hypothetical protein [Glycomyces harbinensis]|uniref:Uncharacterized protein n=1 Tax=Glycomyces harbinensis TaxID=58114 RepID=A0A1G6ZUI1_9ACTN|nr:hypothetical protein [Glycomyces harbinensis]SDE05256.1 hypothetical protein SAMN05216270_111167 [Glycomyces harbinensis]